MSDVEARPVGRIRSAVTNMEREQTGAALLLVATVAADLIRPTGRASTSLTRHILPHVVSAAATSAPPS